MKTVQRKILETTKQNHGEAKLQSCIFEIYNKNSAKISINLDGLLSWTI